MATLNPETPLAKLSGINPRFLSRFHAIGINTVRDLLWHFPTRYEDFSRIVKIADLEAGQQATIQGVVQEINIRRSWRRHMVIVEAIIEDETGAIRVIWFNQPFLKTILQPGRKANFAGKVSSNDDGLFLSHPTHEIVPLRATHETRHTARLIPIYPETRGLTSKTIRFLIQTILAYLEKLEEFVPVQVLARNDLPNINEAIAQVHFPKTIEVAMAAKKRFAFNDIFLLQLYNFQEKLKLAKQRAPSIATDLERLKSFLNTLPFELMPSQKKSLWEIIKDMEKPHPMNRLLQGDVGSGKTVVALLAALSAAEGGFQTAFMAPTEVLVHQHYETCKKLFSHIEFPIAVVSGSAAKVFYGTHLEAEISKAALQEKVRSGEIKIVIGTHALIQKGVLFEKLGLVIIDEQHRFGVKQRAMLLKTKESDQGQKNSAIPHFLSMSATPIPRTLMLTIFGDLDISTITELPTGRKIIKTEVIDPKKRADAYGFIRQQIQVGRQAFVICPRIDPATTKEDEASMDSTSSPRAKKDQRSLWEVRSVKEEYEKLSQKVFPDLRVGMLHGQLKSKEKTDIMQQFKNNSLDILVSTSVIEVGVDVPNATIMMIEGSDRFGLAQLYQFRGRVGRGEHESFCFLFTDSSSQTTNARLKALLEAKNGFELAERDLKIRGPGEFLGSQQTGLPDLAMSSIQNLELIKAARDAAAEIIKTDPAMKRQPLLKEKLDEFQKEIHLE